MSLYLRLFPIEQLFYNSGPSSCWGFSHTILELGNLSWDIGEPIEAAAKLLPDRHSISTYLGGRTSRARARLPNSTDDDDPGQTRAIETWIIDVLQHGGVKVHRSSDGALELIDVPQKWAAIFDALCKGLHAAARGEELPLLWNGMCPAGKHGLDYEGQPCDLCASAPKAPVKGRKRS